MSRLARLGVRHPVHVLATWAGIVAVLGIVGIGVEGRLKPTQLIVPGTEVGHWSDLRKGHFGEDASVLLTGPAAAIDQQGPALARALAARPNTHALSPWSGHGAARLRPTPNRALIVVDLGIPRGETPSSIVPPWEKFVRRQVHAPLVPHFGGLTPIGRDINDATVKSIRTAEFIAYPVLMIVLLLVFRSPVAAAIPLGIAVGTLQSGFGIISIITRFAHLDSIALSIASMIGLALGVDYSLLIVTRFREGLEEGRGPAGSATLAANTAGRTAVFAGVVLVSIMLTTLLLSPGSILLSASVGSIVVTLLSMLGATLITPAAVRLLGERVNKWSIGGRRAAGVASGGLLAGAVARMSRRPAFTTIVALGLLLALAAATLGINTIPPDPRTLPAGSRGLADFLQIRRAGFGPIVETILETPSGTLTDPARLSAIDGFERRLARLRYVKLVVGPGLLEQQTAALRHAPRDIARGRTQLARGGRDLGRLARGLRRARAGVGELRSGIGGAVGGAFALVTGSDQARGGSGQLAAGASRAAAGARRVAHGSAHTAAGAGSLASGAARARSGSARLTTGATTLASQIRGRLVPGATQLASSLRAGSAQLRQLHTPAALTEQGVAAALHELRAMTVGKGDPHYPAALAAVSGAYAAATGKSPVTGQQLTSAYSGLAASIALAAAGADQAAAGADRIAAGASDAAAGADRIAAGASELGRGLGRLEAGSRRLVSGLDSLAAGSPQLAAGVARLRSGAEGLSTGLAQLQGGQQTLANGLQSGYARSRPLELGLADAAARVRATHGQLVSRTGPFGQLRSLDALDSQSPGFFGSGYVTIAALQGARPDDRRSSLFLLDSNRGGQVGRVQVLPTVPPNDPRTAHLVDDVKRAAHALGRNAHIDAAVGGSAGELVDYSRIMQGRIPLIVLGIAIVTYLMLVPILRSLVLPLIAVLLNLVTVGVGFGVLTILFVGHPPLLGGAGALDVISLTGMFSIVFSLSIDYQVFLLSRMREGLVRTQESDAAIAFGIEKTARVVTGAAVIMVSVFLAFALSDFSIIRQFGVGLATAVIVDATVVRLALLPALMRLFGMSIWWLPTWLDERLPLLDIEGGEFEQETRRIRPAT